ncbi:MAG: radical SAM protein [Thermodesulfobacteriota bacterium]
MGLPTINVVQLTVTNRCQCRCRHCGVSQLRREMPEELPLDRIEALFQDLKLAGCRVVDLFGGEPTLRHDLCDIIRRGKAYGFFVSLETNGYVIDEAYMAGLVSAGLDQIYVSLDDYRAERHDDVRGRQGCFDRAVRALELGARAGILMHVSIVPPSREFFFSGDMNRFMSFVRERGAAQVRVLLPRFAGDSIRDQGGPLYAGEEKDLFSYVSPEYYPFIYVHTPGTPPGEKNLCTAKQVFCHIMSNGWMTPCPYFPLVFGDAVREPVVDVFERIQSHPLVRLGGDYCPMRNGAYIDTYLRPLGLGRPFFPITVENQIDLGAPCATACPECDYGRRSACRPTDDILQAIDRLPPDYTRIEFYGGDAFRQDALWEILARVPRHMKIVLWTACGPPGIDAATAERLRSFPVEAVKILLALPSPATQPQTDVPAELASALEKAGVMARLGLPVHLYVPVDLMAVIHRSLAERLHETGVERLYSISRDDARPLVNAVACFGKAVGTARLLWARR